MHASDIGWVLRTLLHNTRFRRKEEEEKSNKVTVFPTSFLFLFLFFCQKYDSMSVLVKLVVVSKFPVAQRNFFPSTVNVITPHLMSLQYIPDGTFSSSAPMYKKKDSRGIEHGMFLFRAGKSLVGNVTKRARHPDGTFKLTSVASQASNM